MSCKDWGPQHRHPDNTGIFNERMELRFDPSGELTILAGTLSHGQGHETA
jgi:carbon-monoxide dehydrogenase large subunit